MNIKTEALKLLRESCALNESPDENTRFDEISIDSLTFVELIVKAEIVFGVEFEEEELGIGAWEKVGDFIECIRRKTKNGKAIEEYTTV